MTKDKQEKPKIVVDDDWKNQAAAEKEKLAEQVDRTAVKPAADAQPGKSTEPPPASFTTLVSGLAGQIYFALGGVEDPKTKQRYVDLAVAKHYIDLLVVLEEKTRGNLTDDEKKLLDQTLYQIRMHYVQIAQHA